MPHSRPFRVRESTAILAVLLLVGMLVAGGAWHNHRGSSAETCQVCHLTHQPAAEHLALSHISVPTPISIAPLPTDSARVAGPSIPLTASRAPPSA